MAVKFTLPDGSTTDVSTQTAKLFPASTPDGFMPLLRAMRPGITAPLRLAGYIATHPRFLAALPVVRAANKVPASYATVAYHGLHAFRWVAADGSARFVRYHLLPAAGEEFLPPRVAAEKSADFLIDELDERLASAPVRFAYQVQIAADGDSTVDPSRPWHSTQTVTVGTIDITGVETEREHGGDIVVFDPMRVTDGIEPSDDPVLRFRTLAYSASVKLRTGRRSRSRGARDLMTAGAASATHCTAAPPRLNLSLRSPNSSRPMCGSRPPVRSISMPGLRPMCCASSSVNCSPTRPTMSRMPWPALGFDDEAQLAAAIRAGELDGRSDQVQSALRALVVTVYRSRIPATRTNRETPMPATGSGHSQHVIAEWPISCSRRSSEATRRRCASSSTTTSRYGEWAPAATTTKSGR